MFLELILVGACALLILRLLLKKPKGIYIQKTNNIFITRNCKIKYLFWLS
jgi:hypothetical protein